MIEQKKTLQAGGLKGSEDNAMIPVGVDPDRILYTLSTTSCYLLETAWGPYALTLTHNLGSRTQAVALLALASHITPIPIALFASTHDLGACIMVQAASLLSENGTWAFTPSTAPPTAMLPLRTVGSDQRILTLLESGMLTDRFRMDVSYMRQRLVSCARRYESEALADGRESSRVLCRLGLMEGDPWSKVAGDLRLKVAA
ncbi:hypothetical protein [Bifidobacterium polysaccharolyticum]|uniref:hypothetical protein n=1 Tax=Bifidobacterium polysaccharolyticum TaxID=2750967 RepID=UPI0018DB8D29|nr:hypothetical protein [Bifidobacterium polysaccharolyticum]MBI0064545.1 hypothetical protein [Bifidobacterium polysaccharolyticum]